MFVIIYIIIDCTVIQYLDTVFIYTAIMLTPDNFLKSFKLSKAKLVRSNTCWEKLTKLYEIYNNQKNLGCNIHQIFLVDLFFNYNRKNKIRLWSKILPSLSYL